MIIHASILLILVGSQLLLFTCFHLCYVRHWDFVFLHELINPPAAPCFVGLVSSSSMHCIIIV